MEKESKKFDAMVLRSDRNTFYKATVEFVESGYNVLFDPKHDLDEGEVIPIKTILVDLEDEGRDISSS